MVTGHVILGPDSRPVAMQESEQGVQAVEHPPKFAKLGGVDWHDLHIFQEVGASKSLRRAALKLGVSVNTVRARIARLEKSIGAVLFARTYEGITLSGDGRELLELALEMQTSAARLQFGRGNNLVVNEGELRIRCTEGIGEFWLTPHIAELQERLPQHAVTLHNDFDQQRIHSSDYDLRLGFLRPPELDTVVSRIGSLHFIMYASRSYIQRFGEPKSMDEAREHKIVIQSAPGLLHDAQQMFIGQETARQVATARVNTSNSLFQAIVNGVGIGALPTYISTISEQLRPLDLPLQLKFDLWLYMIKHTANQRHYAPPLTGFMIGSTPRNTLGSVKDLSTLQTSPMPRVSATADHGTGSV